MRTRPLIAVLLLLSLAAPAAAQTSAALILLPWPQDRRSQNFLSVFGYNGDTQTNDRNVTLFWFRNYGRFRPTTDNANWAVGWKFNYMDIDTDDPLLPERLVDMGAAAGVKFGAIEGWEIGGTGGVGYAGNAPFNDGDAVYGAASLMARTQIDDNSTLTVFIDYDGDRTIFPDIPLPGIAYRMRVDDTFSFTVGFPVCSLDWTPIEHLDVKADWILPTVFNVRAGYQFIEQLEAFMAFQSEQFGYWVQGDNPHRRLFFSQYRVEMGLRVIPCDYAEIVGAVGYAFHQRFERGWDTRDTDTVTVTEITDEPYFRIGLNVDF